MGIIITKQKNYSLSKNDVFGDVVTGTPHYVNFAYSKDGKIHLSKSKKYDSTVWSEISELDDFSVIIYINDTDEDEISKKISNISPVLVDRNNVLVGAGHVLTLTNNTENHSAIRVLAQRFLKKLIKPIPNFLFGYSAKWLISNVLNSSSAIAAINSKGEIAIFNEELGSKINEGIWFFDSFLAESQMIRYQNHMMHEMWD